MTVSTARASRLGATASPAPRTAQEPPESSRERILRVATRLFAEQSFDTVTTRTIAAEVGLNVATVAHHTGSKGQLYEAVFARLHDHETAMLDAALGGVTDADLADPQRVRVVLAALVDAYVDVLAAEPGIAGLWSRRWLDRGAQVRRGEAPAVERQFARPLFDRLEQLLHTAQAAGSLPPVDAHLAVKSVIWITYGYFTGGLLEDAARTDVTDPAQVQRLRGFVHQVVAGLLGSDVAAAPGDGAQAAASAPASVAAGGTTADDMAAGGTAAAENAPHASAAAENAADGSAPGENAPVVARTAVLAAPCGARGPS